MSQVASHLRRSYQFGRRPSVAYRLQCSKLERDRCWAWQWRGIPLRFGM